MRSPAQVLLSAHQFAELSRLAGAWPIPFALNRIAAFVGRRADQINALTAPQTIGEQLYPIAERQPQYPRVYPGPITARTASITKDRVPQSGQPPPADTCDPRQPHPPMGPRLEPHRRVVQHL